MEQSRCEHCVIRQFNSLRALSKEELKRVSNARIMKRVKKGETLFEEGDKLNGVFCVRNGVSKLSKLSSNGKDQIVKLTAKGEVIGQRSVIAEEKANLSARALTDMEVCYIPKDIILDSLHKNPDFTYEVLRHMAHDLKDADDVIVNISQKTVKQRIAAAFLYLKENFGVDKDGFITLVISREDFSGIIGTALESTIRMISEFKKNGLLETSGKKIKIVNEKALKDIVEDL